MTQLSHWLGLGVLALVSASRGWAQSTVGPTPSVPPAGSGTPAATPVDGISSTVILIAAVVAVIVVIGAIAKIYDLRRRREAEAVDLQARLTDALLTDPAFQGTTVTPTVHVPLKGSPVTIEVTGDVPSPELRDRVLRAVRQQAGQARPDLEIEDKVSVMPPVEVNRVA